MESNEQKKLSEILNKMSQTAGKREINDYDSALLSILFEPVTGTTEEKYNKTCDKLVLVLARLKKIYMNEEQRPDIINKIESFFDKSCLPSISSNVDDLAQREGRVISINRNDMKAKISCTMDNFNKIIDRITEEQYGLLANQAKKLLSEAISFLDDNVFRWHRDDIIVEVEPWKNQKDIQT